MTKRIFVGTEKESGNGVPDGSHIVMGLPAGAPIEEAQRVARLLNDYLATIRLARF